VRPEQRLQRAKPRYTKPDSNQLSIENYLQELGFWTYRTANSSPQTNKFTKNKFHPLDLLVLGRDRYTDLIMLSLWEIKVAANSSFTNQEAAFFVALRNWYDSDPLSINTCTDVKDILAYYHWVDT